MPKMITPIQRPPPPGKPGGLGEKVEQTIQRVVANIFNAIKDLLVDILSAGFELFLEVIEQSMAKAARPVIDDILKTPNLPPSVKSYLLELRSPTMQGSALGLGGLVGGLGMNAASSMFAPIFRMINYAADYQLRTARADPALAWVLSWRDMSIAPKLYEGMRELGWPDAMINAFKEAARPRVSEIDMYRAMQRGIISESTAQTELHRRGWAAEDRDIIEKLLHLIPGPSDLVTMAVREAFSPEAIRELGLGAEFPVEFAEWMEKQGFDREWALRYWYAHWALPSLSLGYEMLHREVINESQLKALLKAQDVSPVWRDKLIQVSYSPLTRVDVRRMYGLGVLDRAGVKKAYRELGYNDVNAERLAEFTVRYETDDAREATKSDILSGFREGMLSRAETVDWLKQLNYSVEYANYFVDKEAAALARKRQDSQTSSIKTLYVNHDITEGVARTRLTTAGLASGEIDTKMSDWRIEREAKILRPSRATLDDLFKSDVIGDSEYRQQMGFLGYQDQYLDWYLTLVLEDKAEKARKAEEAARSEQEAIRTRKVRSDYQVKKSELDVSLAELATAIAEMQLAMRARQVRYQQELVIVRKALTAAELEQEAAANIETLQGQITDARDAILFLREQIDQYETAIAANRLEEAEYVTHVKARQAAAATDEEALAIQAEAAAKKLEFETRRRELALIIEQAQDDIAKLNISVLGIQREIATRRVQLREELDIVARMVSEAQLTAEFDENMANMQGQLDSLRVNVARLKEDKARLEVGYRVGLAD